MFEFGVVLVCFEFLEGVVLGVFYFDVESGEVYVGVCLGMIEVMNECELKFCFDVRFDKCIVFGNELWIVSVMVKFFFDELIVGVSFELLYLGEMKVLVKIDENGRVEFVVELIVLIEEWGKNFD